MKKMTKIALWSGPRNISTAMMYSFANRGDTTVVDEPMFGYFLDHTGVWRPSREEVLATMETDSKKVVDALLEPKTDQPIFFMKHMANHLIDLDWDFTEGFKNIILTRNPKDMLLSYTKQVTEPTLLDTTYELQTQLVDFFISKNIDFVVLDSKSVLVDPKEQLTKLCEKIQIPFDTGMLEWPKGARPEDGVWAKYWYHSVHKSTGFGPYKEKAKELPDRLRPLYEACKPHFEKLKQFELK